METAMQTTEAGKLLREQVGVFLSGLVIPDITPAGEPPVRREDGVLEFYKHWRVRGDATSGLFATLSDCDDQIEFGLTERDGSSVINVLSATLVLGDDGGEFNVMSETNAELNLDSLVTPTKALPLTLALRYFGRMLEGA